jgi:hypothetical protein
MHPELDEMRHECNLIILPWINRAKESNELTATVLAVESPRSFWQWVDIITFSIPGVFDFMSAINFPNSFGTVMPTVSGMFRVVAPALITSPNISYRNSLSDLVDSKKQTNITLYSKMKNGKWPAIETHHHLQ